MSSGNNTALFYGTATVIQVTLFVTFSLSTIILSTVCVVALILAKDIDLKMRVALIDVLAPEIIHGCSSAFFDLGYPFRVYTNTAANDASCYIGMYLGTLAFTLRVFVTPFFAVVVYLFLKHNTKKMNWTGTIVFLTASSLCVSILSLSVVGTEVSSDDGSCSIKFSLSGSSLLFTLFLAIALILLIAAFCVVVVFSVLSYRYVKKCMILTNPDSFSPIKTALMRILIFHAAKTLIVVSQYCFSILYFSFEDSISENVSSVVVLVIEYSVLKLVLEIPFLLTPIISIALLKPVREALKQKCCRTAEPSGTDCRPSIFSLKSAS